MLKRSGGRLALGLMESLIFQFAGSGFDMYSLCPPPRHQDVCPLKAHIYTDVPTFPAVSLDWPLFCFCFKQNQSLGLGSHIAAERP